MLQISKLPPVRKKKFLNDLNYLNLKEYQGLCKKYDIPMDIYYVSKNGILKKTGHKDRKAIILKRLKIYLTKGKISKPTVFSAEVVNQDLKLLHPKKNNHLYYGQYSKKNTQMLALLKSLTKNKFEDGAIARELLCEFWSRGHAPTYAIFAQAWLKAQDITKMKKTHPEWAYLYDKKQKVSLKQWKLKRKQIAKSVLATLKLIST